MARKFWSIVARFSLVAVVYGAPTPEGSSVTTDLKYITLEEHFNSPITWKYQAEDGSYDLLIDALGTSYNPLLRNISLRIPNMDEYGIRMQVVANDPYPYVLPRPDIARIANNQLFEAISQYPDRFRGFCFLPMALPQEAAIELEGCVSEFGFLGALVDSHLLNQTYYDDEEYDVLWDAFERLNVLLYLHPTYPQTSSVNGSGGLYAPNHGSFSIEMAPILGTSAWGWHGDTGIGFVLSYDTGHMGNMVPYMLHRIQYTIGATKPEGLTVLEAYAQNIYVTTSGMFSLVPFRALWAITKPERVMYSVDYPWAKNEDGFEFMKELKDSGIVSEEEWENIAHRNAERLLGISV